MRKKETIGHMLRYGFPLPHMGRKPVLVKKNNKNWRICIDFRDLNKVCPKDAYPFLRINQLVDATRGRKILRFMDAYSSYNHIMMRPNDESHTTFYADSNIFC